MARAYGDVRSNNNSSLAKIIEKFDPTVKEEKPDWILIQRDTTTTFISALIGFYCKIRIGHIEAGLRTHNKYRPFPEEINRRLTSVLTDFHFTPTQRAKNNLVSEGIPKEAPSFYEKMSKAANPCMHSLAPMMPYYVALSNGVDPKILGLAKNNGKASSMFGPLRNHRRRYSNF